MKNIGPWLAFTPEWFAQRQGVLLFLLNTPVIRWWFRWVLCIDMADVWMPPRTRIIELGTSYYKVRLPDGRLRLDARTHRKYAKRVYWAFRWVWEAMHAWDTAFADAWAPRLAFGFLTLTVYPDPNPETTSVDGYVYRSVAEESWATIIAGAGNTASDTATNAYGFDMLAGTTTNLWTRVIRGIYLFDTSALGDTDTISAAVMSVRGNNKQDANVATPTTDVYTSTPASNTALAIGDYGQTGSISQTGSPMTYAGWSTTGYNDFTLNATGRGNVSKTAVSKFALRNANYDVAAVLPPWASGGRSFVGGIGADTAGTTTDPKLVVTHSAAATFRPHVIVF